MEWIREFMMPQRFTTVVLGLEDPSAKVVTLASKDILKNKTTSLSYLYIHILET